MIPSAVSGWGMRPTALATGYTYLRSKGYTDEELLAAGGSSSAARKGTSTTLFRHRVMTPIFDLRRATSSPLAAGCWDDDQSPNM